MTTQPTKKQCPNCTGPMQALSWTGYFCRECGAAVTMAEDGWVHILNADLSVSWIRPTSAGGGMLV
jgi:tRNA(Ile2) C34 agmatinyltransferase TiaS